MKIVHELNQLDFGGVEKIIRSIVKHDQKNEHTILAYKDGPFKSKLEEVGAKVILIPDEGLDCDADVIHVHCGGAISQLAQHLGGQFPIVETVHSPVRSPMSDDIITKRVGVCDSVSKLNSNCTTILNGLEYDEIEPSLFSDEVRASLGIRHDACVVGRLGRVGRDKGLEEWLLTCYYLQSRGYGIVPVIVGNEARGCNGYIGKLKLMAASLPVQDIVWVPLKEDVGNYLQIMDVFLYPSATEGFGLVFAEAMFNGAAVVGWKTPVTWELFGGYMAFVDKKDGVHGLVEETEKILRNPEYMSELGGNGRMFVQGEYQAKTMSEEYQELYEQCIECFNGQGASEKINAVSR